MNQNSRFTEISGGAMGTPWDPRANENNGMNYQEGNPANRIEGYLKGVQRDIPTKYENTMTVWTVQTVNPDGTLGVILSVVEDSFLKDKLEQIPLTTYICLEYKGKTLKKGLPPQGWSKTNSYHTWFIGADYGAIPMSSLTVGVNGTLQANVQAPKSLGTPQYVPAANNQAPVQQFHSQQNFQQQPQQGFQPNTNFTQQVNQDYAQQQQSFQQPPVVTPAQQSFQAPPAQQQQLPPQRAFQAPPPQQQQQPPVVPQQQNPIVPPAAGNGGVSFGGQVITGDPFASGSLPF